MIESLVNYDIELLIFLNNLGTTTWDGFWLFITNKFSAIPLYLALLFLCYKYYGLKRTILIVVIIALLIAVTDQTSNLFKNGFKRLRPCRDETIKPLIRLVTCGGKYSYFSAHAANAMAIAIYFGMLFKKQLKYLLTFLVLWAIVIGYSRVYLGVHFPLDVLTGFVIGTTYGFIFYKLTIYIFKRFFS